MVRYLDICDGNMEEGSMRCDANISVRLKGAEKYGTRTEVKNMNSIRNVQRAIEHEVKRQIEAVERGETLTQDTRNFDAVTGTTSVMRSKGSRQRLPLLSGTRSAPPVVVKQAYIEAVRKAMPPLPHELFRKFTIQYGLSEYDAGVLSDTKDIALYFEELVSYTANYKAAANWVMGAVKSYLNENVIPAEQFVVRPAQIAGIIALIDKGTVSNTVAAQKIFPELLKNPAA